MTETGPERFASRPTAGVAILTFGCRVNQADSLSLERRVRARGLELTSVDHADLVFVNTCAVTAAAEQAARRAIRRIARYRPGTPVVVTGCYATARPLAVASLPGVVRVLANDDKPAAAASLAPALPAAGDWAGSTSAAAAPPLPGALGRTMFTLRVQTGCNESCSYCVVPFTRGPGRSLPVADVLDEVARVKAAGFKETLLTGVHLGSYGRDLVPPATLADLLRALVAEPGDLLFRLGSLEPMDFTPDVEAVLAGSRRFQPHLHLPLQHGSDRVLEAMRRPYTLDTYARLVDRVRRSRPDAALGTDVIVGFPGEDAGDFRAMADYLERSPLSYLHVFPYSKRPGTRAATLPRQVPGSVIRARTAEIRRIACTLASRFRSAQVGTVREGLTIEDGSLVVTDNYLKVRVPVGRWRNERVRVRIAADGRPMRGEIVG